MSGVDMRTNEEKLMQRLQTLEYRVSELSAIAHLMLGALHAENVGENENDGITTVIRIAMETLGHGEIVNEQHFEILQRDPARKLG